MKRIIILIATVFLSNGIFATMESQNKEGFWTTMVKNKVNSYMSHPNNHQTGEVQVSYSLEPDGKITIISIVASDPFLRDHVVKQLHKVHINHLDGKYVDEQINCNFKFVGVDE